MGPDAMILVFWMLSFKPTFSLSSFTFSSVQSLSRIRLCNPMNRSMPGLPVHHKLPEFAQTHAHWVGDAIQPSHPLSSPSPLSLYFMANRRWNGGSNNRFPLLGLQNHWTVTSAMKSEVDWLLLGSRVMTHLDSVLKSRNITLQTNIYIVKAMVFPVVTYGCESWTIKKAKRQKIDVFELCCLRRLLKVSWTSRGSNLSVLQEINPEYSLEGLILMLRLQYFNHLMRPDYSSEKSLLLGKIEGRRRRGCQRMKWLDVITDAMNMSLGKL